MKRSLVLVLSIFLVLALTVTGCQSAADEPGNGAQDTSWEEIKERGYFIVGLDDSFPPMGFRDEQNEIVGFDIDMAKAAAELMGVEVKFQPVVWSSAIMELNNKNVDLILNGMTINEERKEQIDFSNPYLQNAQIIVVQKDSPIKTKADLAGKVIAIQAGSTSEDAIKSEPEVYESFKSVKEFSNNTEALLDLKAGRVDAVVVDEVVGRYYVNLKPEDYTILDDDFGMEQYGVGARKGDAAFLAELQKALNTLNENGTAEEISLKWFGKDIVIK
jgi:polar amino acid transport system substrate-binding protein